MTTLAIVALVVVTVIGAVVAWFVVCLVQLLKAIAAFEDSRSD